MLKPFSKKLWLAIFLLWSMVWVVCATVFLLFSKRIQAGLCASPSFIISSITCQGKSFCQARQNRLLTNINGISGHPGYPGSTTSLKIILVVCSISGYLIYCTYNARIIAFLSAPSSYIHTIDDLPLNGYITYTEPHAYHYATYLFLVKIPFTLLC